MADDIYLQKHEIKGIGRGGKGDPWIKWNGRQVYLENAPTSSSLNTGDICAVRPGTFRDGGGNVDFASYQDLRTYEHRIAQAQPESQGSQLEGAVQEVEIPTTVTDLETGVQRLAFILPTSDQTTHRQAIAQLDNVPGGAERLLNMPVITAIMHLILSYAHDHNVYSESERGNALALYNQAVERAKIKGVKPAQAFSQFMSKYEGRQRGSTLKFEIVVNDNQIEQGTKTKLLEYLVTPKPDLLPGISPEELTQLQIVNVVTQVVGHPG